VILRSSAGCTRRMPQFETVKGRPFCFNNFALMQYEKTSPVRASHLFRALQLISLRYRNDLQVQCVHSSRRSFPCLWAKLYELVNTIDKQPHAVAEALKTSIYIFFERKFCRH
jgi:hypothetical protein